jgi:hypothetical protein
MEAISAFTTALGSLRRNPVLFAGVFVLSLIGSLTTLGQLGGPLVVAAAGLGTLIFVPFATGGVLGMAEEATMGKTGLSTLVHQGRANYVALLIATVLQVIIYGLIGVLWIGAIIALVLGGGSLLGGADGAGIAGIGLIAGFVSLLVFLLPVYFLQFYDVAIVVSDTSSWGGFKRSFGFVRRHLLSVLGYTLLAQTVNLVVLIPTFWALYGAPLTLTEAQTAMTQVAGVPTAATVVPLVVVTLLVGTLTSAVLVTYRVTYYTTLSGETPANTTAAAD